MATSVKKVASVLQRDLGAPPMYPRLSQPFNTIRRVFIFGAGFVAALSLVLLVIGIAGLTRARFIQLFKLPTVSTFHILLLFCAFFVLNLSALGMAGALAKRPSWLLTFAILTFLLLIFQVVAAVATTRSYYQLPGRVSVLWGEASKTTILYVEELCKCCGYLSVIDRVAVAPGICDGSKPNLTVVPCRTAIFNGLASLLYQIGATFITLSLLQLAAVTIAIVLSYKFYWQSLNITPTEPNIPLYTEKINVHEDDDQKRAADD